MGGWLPPLTLNRHKCEWCKPGADAPYAIGTLPSLKQWACLKHTELFYHGLCALAGALGAVDRAPDTHPACDWSDLTTVPWTLLQGIIEKARRYDQLRAPCGDCGRLTIEDIITPTELACFRCGSVECPSSNPLHFDSKGCPSCNS